VPESVNKRSQRVGELLQHELASLITNELKDPRVGFVTVTEVRLTKDLKSAKVYLSIYGPDAERQGALQGLQNAAGFLKRQLGQRLELRFIPELVFCLDETLDKAMRLQQLMTAISHGETETPSAAATEHVPAETLRSDLAERQKLFAEEKKQRAQRDKARGRRKKDRGRP
jgi:ribosome-binding factor A